MGGNNRPTVRIGNKTSGVVSGTVHHTGTVKIEVGDKHNFDVGNSIEGDIKKTATVTFDDKVEQKLATETALNPQPKLQDYQVQLKPIGDLTYIGLPRNPKQSYSYNHNGSLVICKQVKGKVNNDLTYIGDGLECNYDYGNFDENSKTIRSNNIGNVTEVEQCNEIRYNSNVTIIPRK